jgi:hypothetical protein
MMVNLGLPVDQDRYINDRGRLNTGDDWENAFKTESRVVHNAKLEFLIIINESTRMNLKLAFVYSRTSDSGYLCGRGFPWGNRGHCDSMPFIQGQLGVSISDKTIVYCSRCTKNYSESDLHSIKKSTAVQLSAAGILHAKETYIMTVRVKNLYSQCATTYNFVVIFDLFFEKKMRR